MVHERTLCSEDLGAPTQTLTETPVAQGSDPFVHILNW
jgi:hypothetical protein